MVKTRTYHSFGVVFAGSEGGRGVKSSFELCGGAAGDLHVLLGVFYYILQKSKNDYKTYNITCFDTVLLVKSNENVLVCHDGERLSKN